MTYDELEDLLKSQMEINQLNNKFIKELTAMCEKQWKIIENFREKEKETWDDNILKD